MQQLQQKVNKLKVELGNNDDVIVRNFLLNKKNASIVFVNSVVDVQIINNTILKALFEYANVEKNLSLQNIFNNITYVGQSEIIKEDFVNKIFMGNVLLFLEGEDNAIAFDIGKCEERAIVEPPTSAVIKGPREGFTENIKTNIGLIRKRVLSNKLKIKDFYIGRITRTNIKLVYIDNVADKKIIKKIEEKLNKIDIDGIIDSSYISDFLTERPYSMFKQIGTSEKPDIVVAKMLEGRIAIIVDGSPIVLTIPYIMMEDIQNSNDYYTSSYMASITRILCLVGIGIAAIAPGFFIAVQLYHYKILPLKMLISIINTTQNLPLNPFLENVFIIILFEVLYEASIRMPKYVGMALSIVGALILGDTAVKAGLISPPGVMIVALSCITVYITPNISAELFILRWLFVILGGLMGFVGIMIGIIILYVYLLDFKNYGAEYLAPFTPFISSDQKDFLLNASTINMKKRPKSIPNTNKRRLK